MWEGGKKYVARFDFLALIVLHLLTEKLLGGILADSLGGHGGEGWCDDLRDQWIG